MKTAWETAEQKTPRAGCQALGGLSGRQPSDLRGNQTEFLICKVARLNAKNHVFLKSFQIGRYGTFAETTITPTVLAVRVTTSRETVPWQPAGGLPHTEGTLADLILISHCKKANIYSNKIESFNKIDETIVRWKILALVHLFPWVFCRVMLGTLCSVTVQLLGPSAYRSPSSPSTATWPRRGEHFSSGSSEKKERRKAPSYPALLSHFQKFPSFQ